MKIQHNGQQLKKYKYTNNEKKRSLSTDVNQKHA